MSRFVSIQRGFSLLEVLVAFSILAISVGTIVELFSTNLRGAAVAGDYNKAILIAETRLAEAEVEQPLSEGSNSGNEGTFSWRVNISPYTVEGGDAENSTLSLQKLAVDVSWGSERAARSIQLTTLRLKGNLGRSDLEE